MNLSELIKGASKALGVPVLTLAAAFTVVWNFEHTVEAKTVDTTAKAVADVKELKKQMEETVALFDAGTKAEVKQLRDEVKEARDRMEKRSDGQERLLREVLVEIRKK